MSTPMFIRQPLIGSVADGGNNPLQGAALSATPTTGLIIATTTETILVEEIAYAMATNHVGGPVPTDAGLLVLFVDDPTGGSPDRRIVVQAIALPAAMFLSGRVKVNITLPVGRSLFGAHNIVKTSDHTTYTNLDVSALGGILR